MGTLFKAQNTCVPLDILICVDTIYVDYI